MWGIGVLDAELHSGSRSVKVSLPDKGVHLVEGGPVLHSIAQGCEHAGKVVPATVCILHTTLPESLNQELWMESFGGGCKLIWSMQDAA